MQKVEIYLQIGGKKGEDFLGLREILEQSKILSTLGTCVGRDTMSYLRKCLAIKLTKAVGAMFDILKHA